MRYYSSGFTLLELLITLGILTVCLVVALPNLAPCLTANKVKSDARDLHNLFATTRMEAIRRNQSVTLIFNRNQYQITAFLDRNNSCELDAGQDAILWKKNFSAALFDETKSDGDGLTFKNNDNGYPCLRWDSRGLPHCNSGGFGAGTAYLYRQSQRYSVVVSKTGKVRLCDY
nr:GspH/FimT family pseudopilin [uncultured Desulfuromonas sp.]